MIFLRRVAGESMLPTLWPGQLVLGVRRKRLRPGDVVIIRHGNREKIKRLDKMEGDRVFALGDNLLHSTDSRDFGWLPRASVIAKVVWPKARRRA